MAGKEPWNAGRISLLWTPTGGACNTYPIGCGWSWVDPSNVTGEHDCPTEKEAKGMATAMGLAAVTSALLLFGILLAGKL